MSKISSPYGLGVLLYAFLNRTELNSPYYTVAKYILTHMDELQNVAIKDLANKTHVSTATISRFCKEIGLQSFAELREVINHRQQATEPHYEFEPVEENQPLVASYLGAVKSDIDQLMRKIDLAKLEHLVDEIHHYQDVATFGAMHMETVSLLLQNNLFRCKKIIETRLDPRKQVELMENTQQKLLVIIFSLSGNYVREYFADISQKEQVKIYVITMNPEIEKLKYVEEVILLPEGADSFSAHPLDSLLIVQLITLLYYEKYVK